MSRAAAIAAVARVIERSAARGLTREAACFLASLCGRALVDGLADAGFAITRRTGGAGSADPPDDAASPEP